MRLGMPERGAGASRGTQGTLSQDRRPFSELVVCLPQTAPPLMGAPPHAPTKPMPLPPRHPYAVVNGFHDVSASPPLKKEKINQGLHTEFGVQVEKHRTAAQKQAQNKAKATRGREAMQLRAKPHGSPLLRPRSPRTLWPAPSSSAFARVKTAAPVTAHTLLPLARTPPSLTPRSPQAQRAGSK